MTRQTQFLLIIIFSAIMTTVGNFAIIYIFHPMGFPITTMLARFILPALFYIIAISYILGRKVSLFKISHKAKMGSYLFYTRKMPQTTH